MYHKEKICLLSAVDDDDDDAMASLFKSRDLQIFVHPCNSMSSPHKRQHL